MDIYVYARMSVCLLRADVCAFRIARLLAGLQKTLLYVLLLRRGDSNNLLYMSRGLYEIPRLCSARRNLVWPCLGALSISISFFTVLLARRQERYVRARRVVVVVMVTYSRRLFCIAREWQSRQGTRRNARDAARDILVSRGFFPSPSLSPSHFLFSFSTSVSLSVCLCLLLPILASVVVVVCVFIFDSVSVSPCFCYYHCRCLCLCLYRYLPLSLTSFLFLSLFISSQTLDER